VADSIVAGDPKPGSEVEVRALLGRWRDNQIELQPLFEKAFLVKEVAPVSQNLSALGAAGLAALDYLRGEHAPVGWVTEQLAVVKQAKKPQAQLLLVITPSIEKLIRASAGTTASPAASIPSPTK
jgi:hexosaminidase